MNEPLKVLKTFEREIVYDLQDAALVTPAMIASLNWPENIRLLRFFLSGRVSDEFGATQVLSERHSTLVVYSASKENFCLERQDSPANMERVKLDSLETLRPVYLETSDKYHYDSGKPLTAKGLEERSMVISTLLPGSKNVCINKAGITAALLVIIKWKDCFGTPVDWVPWVWIEKSLSSEERGWIHSEFSAWLRETCSDRVQCIVEADNMRSRKFFIKMGFHPECFVILKGK